MKRRTISQRKRSNLKKWDIAEGKKTSNYASFMEVSLRIKQY